MGPLSPRAGALRHLVQVENVTPALREVVEVGGWVTSGFGVDPLSLIRYTQRVASAMSLKMTRPASRLDMAAEAASDDLPAEHAELARQLLAHPPAVATTPPAASGPDQFTYRLHVDDGTQHRTFNWAEQEVPDEVRPLLATLNRRAHPAPPE